MNAELGMNAGSAARVGARRVVATYSRYADAQRAVDYLSDNKFPVERVAIVAEGLRFVEQVTGRLNYGRVAMNGALSGAVLGGLFGFLFGIVNWIAPMISAFRLTLYGILYGTIVGCFLSVVFYALSGGERDFSSVSGVDAERYNVLVDEDVADEAARLLIGLGGASGNAAPGTRPVPQPA
jgi:hypothetical protein